MVYVSATGRNPFILRALSGNFSSTVYIELPLPGRLIVEDALTAVGWGTLGVPNLLPFLGNAVKTAYDASSSLRVNLVCEL